MPHRAPRHPPTDRQTDGWHGTLVIMYIDMGLSCMPSRESRHRLSYFGLVESYSLARETSVLGAYIMGAYFSMVPIFAKSLSERKWVLIFMGCL